MVATITLAGATLLSLPPAATAATTIESDDFSAVALDSRWTVTDHVGDGTVDLVGQGTSEANLTLSVPAGTSHDIWGTNRSLRVTQPMANDDFAVSAKFDSVPGLKYQTQGLLVQQDAANWLRFDVYHDGSRLYAYAASTVNGTSTKRLAVRITATEDVIIGVSRSGSTWTMTTAVDGAGPQTIGSFSHSIAPTAVGPFAANHGSGSSIPAFVARVDYVFDQTDPITPEDGGAPDPEPDTTPPVISDITATPASTSATVGWTTDELTTGSVVYGTTTAYGSEAPSPTARTSHSVALSGLQPATTYHYRVVATDGAGNTTSSGDRTFTTEAAPEPGQVVESDDFSAGTLDSRWTVTDHVGDGTVALTGQGTADAHLALSLPAGSSHDIWGTNRSLRVLQPVGDQDFNVDVKFDSVPVSRYQTQGLLIQQDASNWLRFDVYHDGSRLHAYAASTVDGTSARKLDRVVAAVDSVHIRVVREGSTWMMTVQTDDGDPQTIGSFDRAMAPAAVGPFAANHGSGSSIPAFTALVDYVFDPADPIVPEDGFEEPDPEPDTTPPVISGITITPSATGAQVAWTTDELTTGVVEYGRTTTYGSVATSDTRRTSHTVTLSGLDPATTYQVRVTAKDAAENSTASGNRTFTTAAMPDGPEILVWYGDEQTFGAQAQSQEWVNVLGNVSHPDGISALSYRIGSGASRPLSIGPDNRRLQDPGDFNIDIPFDALNAGANSVAITAVATDGTQATEMVTVHVDDDSLSLPHTVAWSGASPLLAQAQPVDGHWAAANGSVRTLQEGYDRVLAIGDTDWTNYEVTVPMTVHSFGPGAYSHLSGAPLIGLGMRWRGHTQVGTEQPAWAWYPVGAYAWYRFHESGGRIELTGNNGSPVKQGTRNTIPFTFGRTFILKVRVQDLAQGARYSMKLWQQGTTEPANWMLTIDDADTQDSGAVALIAHQMDATFGNVQVIPLPAGP